MKKLVVLCILFAIIIGACSAQNSSNERRIIGAWDSGSFHHTWTFGTDGIVTIENSSEYSDNILKYSIVSDKLLLHVEDGGFIEFKIVFSSDGKSLHLEDLQDGHWWLSYNYFLRKK